jgi:hypothetical protein
LYANVGGSPKQRLAASRRLQRPTGNIGTATSGKTTALYKFSDAICTFNLEFGSSGMLRFVGWLALTDVSNEPISHIIKGEVDLKKEIKFFIPNTELLN